MAVKRAHSRCTSSESVAKKVWRRASVSLMPACACSRRACTCRSVGPGQQQHGSHGEPPCVCPSAGGAHAGATQHSTAQRTPCGVWHRPAQGACGLPARPGARRRAHQHAVLRLRLGELRDAVHALALHAEQHRLGDRAAGLLDAALGRLQPVPRQPHLRRQLQRAGGLPVLLQARAPGAQARLRPRRAARGCRGGGLRAAAHAASLWLWRRVCAGERARGAPLRHGLQAVPA